MPLRVRNCAPNVTVFAKEVRGSMVKVTWGAQGQPNDTQRVPDDLADDIDFLNSLEMGILEVLDAPDHIREKVTFETEQIRSDRQRADARATASIDRKQDRDMVGNTCLGPAPVGRQGQCNRQIIQTPKEAREEPPLCSEHRHLVDQFYLVESGSRGEGATERQEGVVTSTWSRAQLVK